MTRLSVSLCFLLPTHPPTLQQRTISHLRLLAAGSAATTPSPAASAAASLLETVTVSLSSIDVRTAQLADANPPSPALTGSASISHPATSGRDVPAPAAEPQQTGRSPLDLHTSSSSSSPAQGFTAVAIAGFAAEAPVVKDFSLQLDVERAHDTARWPVERPLVKVGLMMMMHCTFARADVDGVQAVAKHE